LPDDTRDGPLTEHPAEVVLGRHLLARQLGDRVDRLTAGDAHLDGPEVFEVARNGGLRGGEPFGCQQFGELRLARDGVLCEQLRDAVLTMDLAATGILRRWHLTGRAASS
jgi:hypothetical protein